MNSPKISIITASYNSEKTISDTIESVLNQTYENIEYLIIDGGSTDKTIAIIKQYEDLFQGRLKWISEIDNGIYDAWNKALKLSTGDWIAFVGSDDILLKNAINNYVNAIIISSDLNFISSKVLLVKESLDPIRTIGKPWSKLMLSYNCIAHVGSMHHRSLFNQIGIFNSNYQISGDYDLLLRCSNIIKPYYIPIVTAKVREGGISNQQIFRVAKETLKIKIANNCKSRFICILEYYIMIIKYFLRVMFITRLQNSELVTKNNLTYES